MSHAAERQAAAAPGTKCDAAGNGLNGKPIVRAVCVDQVRLSLQNGCTMTHLCTAVHCLHDRMREWDEVHLRTQVSLRFTVHAQQRAAQFPAIVRLHHLPESNVARDLQA